MRIKTREDFSSGRLGHTKKEQEEKKEKTENEKKTSVGVDVTEERHGWVSSGII